MSTLRYSGQIRIRVTYLDWNQADVWRDGTPRNPNGQYRCFLRGPNGRKATVFVGAPIFLSHGVDSPEAFDDAARASIAFADEGVNEWSNFADYDDGSIFVRRKAEYDSCWKGTTE